MKVILYTIHCPACNVLAKKLDAKAIKYDVVDDLDLLDKLEMRQFPILEVDGNRYNFSDAVKFVNSY